MGTKHQWLNTIKVYFHSCSKPQHNSKGLCSTVIQGYRCMAELQVNHRASSVSMEEKRIRSCTSFSLIQNSIPYFRSYFTGLELISMSLPNSKGPVSEKLREHSFLRHSCHTIKNGITNNLQELEFFAFLLQVQDVCIYVFVYMCIAYTLLYNTYL